MVDTPGNVRQLLENNRRWAAEMVEEDPEFFRRLVSQQQPKYLWIGCSDSRVSADQITGLAPGEVFVHRNIANQVIHTDFNCLSVIQYAVEILKVEHIIVCGHYNCGGVMAALSPSTHGFVDNWLRHLKDLYSRHQQSLECLAESQRQERMVELNVMHQVLQVGESSFVRDAWSAGQNLTLHGWVYSLRDGILNDLRVSLQGETQAIALRGQLTG